MTTNSTYFIIAIAAIISIIFSFYVLGTMFMVITVIVAIIAVIATSRSQHKSNIKTQETTQYLICVNCNSKIPNENNFCIKCGEKIK